MTRQPAALRALLDDARLAGLLDLLSPAGEETRIVGGAIRNALLGLAVSDIDLGTTLRPDSVMRRAGEAGWNAVPTGIDHGTVTLVQDSRAFEVTTLREDIATDGRHAEVRFGRDFAQDAARRDFTINAMSMERDGTLHDYFGGRADLAAGRVVFIGDPDQRLREDYLRGLRFLRFSASYGGGSLDAAGLAAVIRNRQGFARLSRERIRQEMLKLVVAPEALVTLVAAEAHALISDIVGLPLDLGRLERRLALAAREGRAVPDAMGRLAALFLDGEDALARLRESLRLTNAEERALGQMTEALRLLRANGAGAIFDLGDRYPGIAPEALRLHAAETGETDSLTHLPQLENPPRFLVQGKDVLALGIPPGPDVGAVLAEAKARWAAAGCPAGAEAQQALLRAVVAAFRAT